MPIRHSLVVAHIPGFFAQSGETCADKIAIVVVFHKLHALAVFIDDLFKSAIRIRFTFYNQIGIAPDVAGDIFEKSLSSTQEQKYFCIM